MNIYLHWRKCGIPALPDSYPSIKTATKNYLFFLVCFDQRLPMVRNSCGSLEVVNKNVDYPLCFLEIKIEELNSATLLLSLQNVPQYLGICSLLSCSSFKTVSHGKFTKRDRLLVRVCYSQSQNVEKLELWNHFGKKRPVRSLKHTLGVQTTHFIF